MIEAQYDELRHALDASAKPHASALHQMQAMARAYIAWGVEHPGAYQLLFESADVFPEDLAAVGPGRDLLDRVSELVRAHGVGRAADSHRIALRMWASLHGLVSLRVHKPSAPWTASAEADAAAVVASLLPTARA